MYSLSKMIIVKSNLRCITVSTHTWRKFINIRDIFLAYLVLKKSRDGKILLRFFFFFYMLRKKWINNIVLKTELDRLVWSIWPPAGYDSDSIWLIEPVKSWTGIRPIESTVKSTIQFYFFLSQKKKLFDAFCTKTTMFPKGIGSIYEEIIRPICYRTQ